MHLSLPVPNQPDTCHPILLQLNVLRPTPDSTASGSSVFSADGLVSLTQRNAPGVPRSTIVWRALQSPLRMPAGPECSTQESLEKAGPLRYEAASHWSGTACILTAPPFLDGATLSTETPVVPDRRRVAPRRRLERRALRRRVEAAQTVCRELGAHLDDLSECRNHPSPPSTLSNLPGACLCQSVSCAWSKGLGSHRLNSSTVRASQNSPLRNTRNAVEGRTLMAGTPESC